MLIILYTFDFVQLYLLVAQEFLINDAFVNKLMFLNVFYSNLLISGLKTSCLSLGCLFMDLHEVFWR